MAVKKYNPITPGTRTRVGNAYAEITTNKPEKSLLAPMKRSGGRNNQGRRSMRQIGGGHKQRYRVIDFKRTKDGMTANVVSIEYDPNRTAFIALLEYTDGEKTYIIAPNGLTVGMSVVSGKEATPDVGNALPLANIPVGSMIHSIELQPGRGAAMARSAGTYGQLLGRDGKYAIVRLPSGETRMVLLTCKATMGTTSNPDHSLTVLGKAGRARWLGRRPHVRGVAMNPVDHPMGGGEGRASGGHPRNRNGKPAKGAKTRDKKKSSSKLIISRRKNKK